MKLREGAAACLFHLGVFRLVRSGMTCLVVSYYDNLCLQLLVVLNVSSCFKELFVLISIS